MRMLAAALLFAGIALADEPADRAAIDTIIHSLTTASNPAALFTADADSDLDRLRAVELNMNKAAHMPWTELGPAVLVIDKIRFVTTDVAIANGYEAQTGSMITSQLPLLFVMKRENDTWKIALLRLLSPSPVEISRRVRR